MDKINLEQWKKEIDALRPTTTKFGDLTEEQKRDIKYAMSGKHPLGYTALLKFLKSKYDICIARSTLRD